MALTCATHLVLLHQVLFGLSRWAKPSAEPPTATTPTPILHFWARSQNTGSLEKCLVKQKKQGGRRPSLMWMELASPVGASREAVHSIVLSDQLGQKFTQCIPLAWASQGFPHVIANHLQTPLYPHPSNHLTLYNGLHFNRPFPTK